MKNLSEKGKEFRNAYQRVWRRKNPEKLRQYSVDYWERKAAGYSVIQKARDLSQQGLTQREISEELSISLGTVNAYLNKQ